MDNWSSVNNWGMISWGRCMISWSGVDNGGSMNNRSMVSRGRGSMVDRSRGITLLDWESSWGNISSGSLLIATIAMYRLRSSVRLAHNGSMYSSMGLVDRVAQ